MFSTDNNGMNSKWFRPLKKLKRKRSWWPRGFSNKAYPITDHDEIGSEECLVLQTGPGEANYQLVYEDEGEYV